MPIDRCGFSSWRDREEITRTGGTCGDWGESRLRAWTRCPQPGAPGGVRCGGACARGCAGASAEPPLPEPPGRGSAELLAGSAGGPARLRGCAAPAPPLTPPRPSPAPPLLRSSAFSTQISLPNIPTPLYNKSFLFTKTVVIRPRVNRM